MGSGKEGLRARPWQTGWLGTQAAAKPRQAGPWRFRGRRAGAGHDGPRGGPHCLAPGSRCPGRLHLPRDRGGSRAADGAQRRGRAEGAERGRVWVWSTILALCSPRPVPPPRPPRVLVPRRAAAHRRRSSWTCHMGAGTRERPAAGRPEGVAAGAAPGGRCGWGVGRWPGLRPHLAPRPQGHGAVQQELAGQNTSSSALALRGSQIGVRPRQAPGGRRQPWGLSSAA